LNSRDRLRAIEVLARLERAADRATHALLATAEAAESESK